MSSSAGPNAIETHWLVRKSGERITLLGPYLTDQVRMMVEQGMLDPDDELCRENGYWFALHEKEELKSFLGIERLVVRKSEHDEESTQPDLATNADITDPDLELDQSALTDPESTGIITIKRPAPQQLKPTPTPVKLAKKDDATPVGATAKHDPNIIQPNPLSASEIATRFKRVGTAQYLGYGSGGSQPILRLEKGRFWGILFFISVFLAALGVVWVLKSLKV